MLTMSSAVLAQSAFPEKPVRIIVGFIAGGSGADLIARLVGPKLSEWWRQPVIVDNMPGQVGNIAAARVAKSPPDGHTLVATGDAAMTTNVTLYGKQLPYDPTERSRADHASRALDEYPRRASFAAGAQRERARRAREGESGEVELRLGGQRIVAAPWRRAI